jgi:hypothetical protein
VITKHNIAVIAASLVIAAAIPVFYNSRKQVEEIRYQIFQEGAGWGYDIIQNDHLIIHQQYIPAIDQKKEFSSEIQARETATLVIAKLRGSKFPTLSKAEVEQICSGKH